MSLASQITLLATRIADEFKTVYSKMGDLTTLTTTAKTNLVSAINEVKASIGSAGPVIDDSTASTTTVYSSNKTESEISAAITALINGAPSTLDTLKEIADALAADESAIGGLTTAIGNRVRFDAAQTLTGPQQVQAIANIGAILASDVGSVTTDFVGQFNTELAS